jgi:hypothetical protein
VPDAAAAPPPPALAEEATARTPDGVALAAAGSADSSSAGAARFVSTDVATEILRWSMRMPKWAIRALSTFLTVCFGVTSAVVSKWISSTAPVSPVTIRAAIIPGKVARSSSARFMGSTLPAIADDDFEDGILAAALKNRLQMVLQNVGLQ